MAEIRAMPDIKKMGLGIGEMAKKAKTMTTKHWSPPKDGEKTVSSKSKKKGKKNMKGGQDGGEQGSGKVVPPGAPDADNLAAFLDARQGTGFKPYVSGQPVDIKDNGSSSGSAISGQDNNMQGGGKKSRKGKRNAKKGKRSAKKGKMHGGQDVPGSEGTPQENADAIAGVVSQVKGLLKNGGLDGATNAAVDSITGTDSTGDNDGDAGPDGDGDSPVDNGDSPDDKVDSDPTTGTDANTSTESSDSTSDKPVTGGGRKRRHGRKTKKQRKSKVRKSKKGKKGRKTRKSRKTKKGKKH